MPQLQRLTILDGQRSGSQIQLTESQRHYLGRVLRLREGEQFIAMNGQGQAWLATLQSNPATAELLHAVDLQTELPIALTLLMALPKTGMDDVVRQATEIGVTAIQPILSQRTLLQPSPQKLDRWRRIAQEAAEQSERQFIPEILEPQSWQDALQIWNGHESRCYFCEARGTPPPLLTCLLSDRTALETAPSLIVAIGPEGGWTEEELQRAVAAGYQPVSLGARILRSVTAPLVALALVAATIESQRHGKDL
ncbi:MAG: 16S rRNA (uracil(1498)-N(3))-methyltransferase [Synechococcales cyanobacterium M58_A2018_015]|nr:16S rRNA (uracil(1498)-N(3))-methyltransferase [Synechococcales cyanobacterium M58_A2018_015]